MDDKFKKRRGEENLLQKQHFCKRKRVDVLVHSDLRNTIFQIKSPWRAATSPDIMARGPRSQLASSFDKIFVSEGARSRILPRLRSSMRTCSFQKLTFPHTQSFVNFQRIYTKVVAKKATAVRLIIRSSSGSYQLPVLRFVTRSSLLNVLEWRHSFYAHSGARRARVRMRERVCVCSYDASSHPMEKLSQSLQRRATLARGGGGH